MTSIRPLFVSLKLGITDKGKRLNPIYGNVQPLIDHFSLNNLVSFATIYADLSDRRPAIGNEIFDINLPLLTMTIPP